MKTFLKSVGYVLFYFMLQAVIVSAVAMTISSAGDSKAQMELFISRHMLFLTLLSNILTIVVLGVVMKVRKRDVRAKLGIHKVSLNAYVLPCVIAFAYSMVFALATSHMKFENSAMIQTGAEYYSDMISGLGVLLQIAALLIAAPIAEELICRGLILHTLRKEHGKSTAVLLSALLFGILHIMAGGGVLVLNSLMAGVIFGVICVKTGSLLPAIAAHMFANIPDFILALLPELSGISRAVLMIVSLAVLVASAYKFMRET